MGLDPMDIVGLPDPHQNSDTEYFVGPPLQDRPAVDIPPSWGCLSAVVVEVPAVNYRGEVAGVPAVKYHAVVVVVL